MLLLKRSIHFKRITFVKKYKAQSLNSQKRNFAKMSRSLDDMTASELNAAIDDTNFPKPMQSPSSCSSIPSHLVSSLNLVNGHNGITLKTNDNNETDDEIASMVTNTNGHKHIIKREHPTPLKMVAFKEDSIDVPGTPRTPRTSTTPGTLSIRLQIKPPWNNKCLFTVQ